MYPRLLRANCQRKHHLWAGLLLSLLSTANVWAEGDEWMQNANQGSEFGSGFTHVHVDTGYVLGVDRFDLDEHTEILGWRLNDSWYFGRQDGEDSGLTLVWQATTNQVSLSKDGVRLTRRF